jgi:phosphoenolpyruvate carboxykinase (ATP)
MYHFISGYTAKVAGTEMGITEPQTTFSACFGKAFLPLHPGKYAELLGKKLKANPNINVWLVNTGWVGGAYGVGSRIKLAYTRALITAALEGKLNTVEYGQTPFFKLRFPKECPGVPAEILEPRNSWADKTAFDNTAMKLAEQFTKNFTQYASGVSKDILDAAPIVNAVSA